MNKINTIKIKEPIWWNRSVGLDEKKLTDITKIKILYKDTMGNLLFPHTYTITKTKALNYHLEFAKRNKNIKLRIIPINALTIGV